MVAPSLIKLKAFGLQPPAFPVTARAPFRSSIDFTGKTYKTPTPLFLFSFSIWAIVRHSAWLMEYMNLKTSKKKYDQTAWSQPRLFLQPINEEYIFLKWTEWS